MSARLLLACKYCGKTGFKSPLGLQQHIQRVNLCYQLSQNDASILTGHSGKNPDQTATEETDQLVPGRSTHRETSSIGSSSQQPPQDPYDSDNSFGGMDDDDGSTSVDEADGASVVDTGPSSEANRYHLEQFVAYCKAKAKDPPAFTEDEVNAIKLLSLLHKKKASLDTYDDILAWHLEATGRKSPRIPLRECHEYISRPVMLKKLYRRYTPNPLYGANKTPQYYKTTPTILPISKAKVNVITHDARDMVISLLTDPRFTDDDFLHLDNNPMAAPPVEGFGYIEDVNTGESYANAYEKYITNPEKQILLPIILYIDGAVTGQFDKLQVESLKMTLGILNRKARDKVHAWRDLGFVPNYHKSKSRGKKLLVDTGHDAATNLPLSEDEGEDEATSDEESSDSDSENELNGNDYDANAHASQDFHHVLSIILASLKKLQQEGMVWHYKYRGKVYKDVEFVSYIDSVKCDGEEADKLCSKYSTRTSNVANLCRYCTCPTEHSDWVYADRYKKKTEERIQKLVAKKDEQGLQQISQKYLKNAFYGFKFGHDGGIHQSCPMEMLHHILLGVFAYLTACLKDQIGKSSVLLHDVNALGREYGRLLSHQSDRDYPKTTFTKGIFQGKIMGKEQSGVLLVIAAVLRSDKGQALLKTNKKFQNEATIKDWSCLVETLLQWEAYLKRDVMEKKHLRKLKSKHRYIMWLTKKVLKRTKGMGMKIMKFHGILHLVDDILWHGVPSCMDTGSNESHHKLTKVCAKLTQRDITVFEAQTAQRLVEFLLLELAIAELDGKKIWEYFVEYDYDVDQTVDDLHQAVDKQERPSTGGTSIEVQYDSEEEEVVWSMGSGKCASWDRQLLEWLNDLQEDIGCSVCIRTEHKRKGEMFRGHPNYRGNGAWNDWAIFDWGNSHGHLPGNIWCFVDFRDLADENPRYFDGCQLSKGVFAVIESAKYVDREDHFSEMFWPLEKESKTKHDDGSIEKRRFYLADVEAIVDAVCVIPNISSERKDEYFQVTARKQWASDFVRWLEVPFGEEEAEINEDETRESPPVPPPKPAKRPRKSKKLRK